MTRKHARNNPTLLKAWEKVRNVLSFPESSIAEQIKLSTTLQSKFTDYRLIEQGCYLVHNRPNISLLEKESRVCSTTDEACWWHTHGRRTWRTGEDWPPPGLKSGSSKRFGSAEVKLQLQFGPPMLPELQIMLDLKITFLVLFSCTFSYLNKRFESCI